MTTKFKDVNMLDVDVKNPIFIVGCGHSGNSLMLTILGSHERIYPVPNETSLFCGDRQNLLEEIRLIEEKCFDSGKVRYVEKTPKHIYEIDDIIRTIPESRILLMLRDGRDVACSIKAREKDFNVGLERWIKDNSEVDKYKDNASVLLVKYEELVQKTEVTLHKIFDFIGETYTPEVLGFYKNKRNWFNASSKQKPDAMNTIEDHKNLRNWQVHQPIFDGSGRWKQEMTVAEKKLFKIKAQMYLELFEYEDNDDW